MALKRKRSEECMAFTTTSPYSTRSVSTSPSTAASSSSSFASPPLFTVSALPLPQIWGQSRALHNDSGRTMKRFRDPRPDQEIVHQTTIAKLFDAQKRLPSSQVSKMELLDDTLEDEVDEMDISIPVQPEKRQTTLHSFWKIPQQVCRIWNGLSTVQDEHTR